MLLRVQRSEVLSSLNFVERTREKAKQLDLFWKEKFPPDGRAEKVFVFNNYYSWGRQWKTSFSAFVPET